jgi:hypothetical protein
LQTPQSREGRKREGYKPKLNQQPKQKFNHRTMQRKIIDAKNNKIAKSIRFREAFFASCWCELKLCFKCIIEKSFISQRTWLLNIQNAILPLFHYVYQKTLIFAKVN